MENEDHGDDGIRAEYSYAIKAGSVMGIGLFAITVVFSLFRGNSTSLSIVVPLLILGIFIWLTIVVIGYHVVSHSKGSIRRKRDAIIVSAIAGAVAGTIDGFAQFVIFQLIPDAPRLITGGLADNDARLLALFPLAAIVIISITTLLSTIGGAIYLARIVKIS